MEILFFLIGILLGAGVLYLVLKKRIERSAAAELELKQARQALADAEEAHQLRLKEAIAALQSDYQEKNKGNLKALSEKYEAKLYDLEQQLRATVSQATTPEAIADVTPETTPTENSVESITFAPPILAAEITYLTPIPPISASMPTGKAIDPPILAQFAKTISTPIINNLPPNFEPPILAAIITYLTPPPSISSSTPTGKIIEPPILAQSIADITPTMGKLTDNTDNFEPPILAATIKFADQQPEIQLSTPIGKAIEPPILAQT